MRTIRSLAACCLATVGLLIPMQLASTQHSNVIATADDTIIASLQGAATSMTVVSSTVYIGKGAHVEALIPASPNRFVRKSPIMQSVYPIVALEHTGSNLLATTSRSINTIDITNPDLPIVRATLTSTALFQTSILTGGLILAAGGPLTIFSVASNGTIAQLSQFVSASGYRIAAWGSMAYLVNGTGTLQIVDISNPSSPQLIGTLAIPGANQNWLPFLSVYNGILVTSVAGNLISVDVKVPSTPAIVGQLRTELLDITSGTITGHRLYVVSSLGDLHGYDVSNPGNIQPIARIARNFPGFIKPILHITANKLYRYEEISGLRIYNIDRLDVITSLVQAQDGAVGDAADVLPIGPYVLTAGSSGYRVYDVANPRMPLAIGGQPSFDRRDRLFRLGRYIWATANFSSNSIAVFSGAGVPYFVQTLTIPGLGSMKQLVADGQYAYYASSSTALGILDIGDPLSPIVIYTLPGMTSASFLAQDDNIVLSGDSRTITIYRLMTPTAPSIAASLGATQIFGGFGAGTISGIAISATHAYVSTADDGGKIAILDLSSPTQPVVVRVIPVPGLVAMVQRDRDILIRTRDGLAALETVSPQSPTVVVVGSGIGPCSGMARSRNRFFAACGSSGLYLLGSDAVDDYGRRNIHLPLAQKDAVITTGAMGIARLEVTQGSQTIANSVPLIASRATMVRVFVNSGGNVVDNVVVTLAGDRNGVALPGSPLTFGPWAAFPVSDRNALEYSYNFVLPLAWRTGQVRLTATISPQTPQGPSSNSVSQIVDFSISPELRIKFVPLRYIQTSTGRVFEAPNKFDFVNSLVDALPISSMQTTFRPVVEYRGDLSSSGSGWTQLLDLLSTLKRSDNAPSAQIYYGLLNPLDLSGNPGTFGFGGIARDRVSVGQYDSARIAVHEMGHNLGLAHAPCGGAPAPDTAFPYADGGLGNPAYEASTESIHSSNQADVMGYCGGQWMSDYNFRKALLTQERIGQAARSLKTQSVYLLRVTIEHDGTLTWRPGYFMNTTPDTVPNTGTHSLDWIDTNGNVVASQPFTPSEVHDADGALQATLAMPLPLNAAQLLGMEIRRGETILASRDISNTRLTSSAEHVSVEPTTGQLSWSTVTPVLVRYSTDEGQSWVTIGVDITGGKITVNAADLPSSSLLWDIVVAD